jgi:hypothetical protein
MNELNDELGKTYDTDPADLRLANKWAGMEASSSASFNAVSRTE